jgi:hypothetical protein
MSALLAQAQRQLPPAVPPPNLASLLFSCARLGHPPAPALLAAAADGAALAAEGAGGLRPPQVVRCLWALGVLGALDAPRLGWLLVQLAAGRWAGLSGDQLAAVGAARQLMGRDGSDLAAEILPEGLGRRVDAAWAEAGLADLARGGGRSESGGRGGGDAGMWAAAEAAAAAWLSGARGDGGGGGGNVARVALPGGAAAGELPGHAAGAWVVSPPLRAASLAAWQLQQGEELEGQGQGRGGERQLVLLAHRSLLLGQHPVRVSGSLLLHARLLASLLGGGGSGGDGDGDGDGDGEDSSGGGGCTEGSSKGSSKGSGGSAGAAGGGIGMEPGAIAPEVLLLIAEDWAGAAAGPEGPDGAPAGLRAPPGAPPGLALLVQLF